MAQFVRTHKHVDMLFHLGQFTSFVKYFIICSWLKLLVVWLGLEQP